MFFKSLSTGRKEYRPSLFWDIDMTQWDDEKMKQFIIQRVVERGWPDDWCIMIERYGISEIRKTLKKIPYLNHVDMRFASIIFNIPEKEMTCYKRRQLKHEHWNC
jgi:hypothetical protein